MERQITVYDRIVKKERVGEIQRKFIQYVRIVFKVWGGGGMERPLTWQNCDQWSGDKIK